MDDQPDIGHVEAHAEGVGTDDDRQSWLDSSREPSKKHVAFVGRAELGVVKGDVQPDGFQAVKDALAGLDGRHEYHRAALRHHAAQGRDDLEARDFGHRQAQQGDVGAVHAGHDHARVRYVQRLKDAFLGLDTGGGGEGEDGRVAQLRPRRAQAAVVRAKVASPAINAVRFINDEEAGLAGGDELDLVGADHAGIEALGRAVEEFERVACQQFVTKLLFVRIQIAVDERARDLLAR